MAAGSTATVSVSALIQTALAPMFLLSAVGATLSVIDNRLNRIVDRARALEPRLLEHPQNASELQAEIDHFIARAQNIARAAGLCALTALAVACVVVLIFIDLQTTADLSLLVEAVFSLAVVLYVAALSLYLRDVAQVGVGLGYLRSRIGAVRPPPSAEPP